MRKTETSTAVTETPAAPVVETGISETTASVPTIEVSANPVTATVPCKTRETDDGPEFVCSDGKVIPLLSAAFPVTLIQPGSVKRDKSLAPHKGKYLIKEVDEYTDVLYLIPIGIVSQSKQMFSKYEDGNSDKPICWSYDREFPAVQVPNPISFQCGKANDKTGLYEGICPKNQWKNKTAPECNDVYRWMFFDTERNIPLSIQLKGTAISVWNQFKRTFEQEEKTAKSLNRIKGKSGTSAVMVLRSSDEGSYYKFDIGMEMRENLKEVNEIVDWYRHNLLASMTAEHMTKAIASKFRLTQAQAADRAVETEMKQICPTMATPELQEFQM